jgi:hypothetical protein
MDIPFLKGAVAVWGTLRGSQVISGYNRTQDTAFIPKYFTEKKRHSSITFFSFRIFPLVETY